MSGYEAVDAFRRGMAVRSALSSRALPPLVECEYCGHLGGSHLRNGCAVLLPELVAAYDDEQARCPCRQAGSGPRHFDGGPPRYRRAEG